MILICVVMLSVGCNVSDGSVCFSCNGDLEFVVLKLFVMLIDLGVVNVIALVFGREFVFEVSRI